MSDDGYFDDEIYDAAKRRAHERAISIGEALAEMEREGVPGAGSIGMGPGGFPVFWVPKDAKTITPEDVKRAEDEMY